MTDPNRKETQHRNSPGSPGRPGASRRKPYTTPHLEVFGDIRDVTLGGSPGIGDSGSPIPQEPR
jgi:hypothetical protein